MFKAKRMLCLVLSLLMLICFTMPVYAIESTSKVIQLSPDVQTEKILDNVELIMNTDSATLTVKDHKEKDAGLESYTVTIDKENKTYKARKATGKELEKITSTIERNSPSSKSGLSSRGSYSLRVAATTFDPPGYVLCQTYNELYWYNEGTTSYLQSRYEGYYAANPSILGTHWYCNGLYWTGLSQGVPSVTSSNTADFYNWDFILPNYATYVSHSITCQGGWNGSAYYTASTTRSGEDYFLLSFNYTTY
ncbi:MAG: hypothetical protein FNP40_08635 [Dehalobacter sp. 4CP]|uniref:hypothetical protein n=1 Tax=Dehalobacter sp. CP TaxID=2594474 RepID=UPI0013CDBF71|nr:hypothetical protein [Dehalobacter sp.]NBJ15618.1 hypothetical protein [Dehalobacter sp. 4CP]